MLSFATLRPVFLCFLLYTRVAFAQSPTISFSAVPTVAIAGRSYTIQWGGGDGTPIDLVLQKGPDLALNTIDTLVSGFTGTSYTWTPETSLVTASDYILYIMQGSEKGYSNKFTVVGADSQGSSSVASVASSTPSAPPSSAASAASSTPSTSASSVAPQASSAQTSAPNTSTSTSVGQATSSPSVPPSASTSATVTNPSSASTAKANEPSSSATSNPSSASASRLSAGAIAGIVLGALGLIVLTIIAILMFRKRDRGRSGKKRTDTATETLPADPELMSGEKANRHELFAKKDPVLHQTRHELFAKNDGGLQHTYELQNSRNG